MSWTEDIEHRGNLFATHLLQLFRELIPKRLAYHQNPRLAACAVDQLSSDIANMILIRGPEFTRGELEPIKHVIPAGVARYLATCEADELATMIFDYSNATHLYEILGIPVPPSVLESFRPYLPRVMNDRHGMAPDYWTKALTAMALSERMVWAPIAGFLPNHDMPFTSGATFELNIQGLIAHLGGALLHGAQLSDVMPAWRDFLRVAPDLDSARQITWEVVFWIGRIVYHHIGGAPLGTVAQAVHDDVQHLVALGV